MGLAALYQWASDHKGCKSKVQRHLLLKEATSIVVQMPWVFKWWGQLVELISGDRKDRRFLLFIAKTVTSLKGATCFSSILQILMLYRPYALLIKMFCGYKVACQWPVFSERLTTQGKPVPRRATPLCWTNKDVFVLILMKSS